MVRLVFSFREGCSGNFFAELLLNQPPEANFRQDQNGVSDSIFHFDGYDDKDFLNSISSPRLKQATIVTHHNNNYALNKKSFPKARILKIHPKTFIFNAIYNAFYKLGALDRKLIGLLPSQTYDIIYKNIIDYYELITVKDNLDGFELIDFGDLYKLSKVKQLVLDLTGTELTATQEQFYHDYISKQLTMELTIPLINTSAVDLVDQFNLIERCTEPWFVSFLIAAYEFTNNKTEQDRLWGIDNITDWITADTLLDFAGTLDQGYK